MTGHHPVKNCSSQLQMHTKENIQDYEKYSQYKNSTKLSAKRKTSQMLSVNISNLLQVMRLGGSLAPQTNLECPRFTFLFNDMYHVPMQATQREISCQSKLLKWRTASACCWASIQTEAPQIGELSRRAFSCSLEIQLAHNIQKMHKHGAGRL